MRFCIIGGKGRMGLLLSEMLLGKGHEVVIVDKDNILELDEKLGLSDIIIISVPLSESTQIICDLKDRLDSNKLVVDISSNMLSNLEAMKALPCESVFVHPLFGPNTFDFKDKNLIIVKVNDGKKLNSLLEVLSVFEFHMTFSDIEKHDKMMAALQCLTHFNNLIFARTLFSNGFTKQDIDSFSTTLFNDNHGMITKLFSQKPDLIANIQFRNKNTVPILKAHKQSFELFFDIIEKKDATKFAEQFESIAALINPNQKILCGDQK